MQQPLPEFQYLEPKSIEEASRMLAELGNQAMVIGGGTDMVPSMRQGLLSPKYLVSLQAIAGLRGIRWDDDEGLIIGPLTTLRSVETNPEVLKRFSFVAQAAHAVASPQVREMATVGGNICLDTRCNFYNQSGNWRECSDACTRLGGEYCKGSANGRARKCFAVFSGDLATALVAADARITLHSARGERSLALCDYYTGNGAKPHARESDELLTGVAIPSRMQGVFGTYLKYRVRNSIDYPIAGVALTLRSKGAERISDDVRLVISGIVSKPLLVKGVPELLNGKPLDDSLIEQAAAVARKAATPLANTAGDRNHRKLMIYEFTRQALVQAMSHVH